VETKVLTSVTMREWNNMCKGWFRVAVSVSLWVKCGKIEVLETLNDR
jgi:hypothetical protein